MEIIEAGADHWPAIWPFCREIVEAGESYAYDPELTQDQAQGFRSMQFNAVVETNVRAVHLWRSLGFAIVGTVPEAFDHPTHGYVGLHVTHRFL